MIVLFCMGFFLSIIVIIYLCVKLSEYLEEKYSLDFGTCLWITVYGAIIFIASIIAQYFNS
jgi:hypothetical protein